MKCPAVQVSHWLVLFLLTDLTFTFLVWLLRPDVVGQVSLLILLFTGLVMAAGVWLEARRRRRVFREVERLLDQPDQEAKAALIQAAGGAWAGMAEELSTALSHQRTRINERTLELAAYRDYIEGWIHQIKTPLSLSTLVLHNHQGEMSPYVYERMSYVQHQINEHVERILYYARLQADHADYRFGLFRLDVCVKEVAEEYRPFAQERQADIALALAPVRVESDEKVVRFLFAQLLGNAVKYCNDRQGTISVSLWEEGDQVCLAVRDNGKGVPPEDAPFLFDKGFTGSYSDRQKATGMGLYLVKKYGERLGIGVRLEDGSTTGDGFGIRLVFMR